MRDVNVNAMSVCAVWRSGAWSGGLWSQVIRRVDCGPIFDRVPRCFVGLGRRTMRTAHAADTTADTASGALTDLVVNPFPTPTALRAVTILRGPRIEIFRG